jgi:hypothetical protein
MSREPRTTLDKEEQRRQRVSDNKTTRNLRGINPQSKIKLLKLIERRKKLLPHLEDFDIIRIIGKGGFSTVF